MADVKITALTAISANPINPATFPMPMVDLLDNSMAASGSTRKVTVNQILGSGGTATLASATITGAATVGTTLGVTGVSSFAAGTALLPALTRTGDTNTGIYYPAADTVAVTTGGVERCRVDSSGYFGIGVAPSKPLQVKLDGVDSGAGWYIIGRLTNAAETKGVDIGYNNTSNLATITAISGGVSSGFEFWAYNGAWYVPAAITTSGNLSLSTGNVVMATSGKGIDFSATTPDGSGTVTDELLDDYEEGTFTPTIVGSTTPGTVTYATQTGHYTKIGRIVQFQIFVAWSAGIGGVGNLRVTGLPFTANATTYTTQAIYPLNVALTAGNIAVCQVQPGDTYIGIIQIPTGGGADAAVPWDLAGQLIITGTYMI